jgi:hypothetical protein
MNPYVASRAMKRREQPVPDHETIPHPHIRLLRTADRACCCSARPSVVAVLPAAPGREHLTELLFCSHHYRECRPELADAGAIVFDAHGKELALASR